MNELQKVFSYNGAQVRTVMVNDEPWFVAKDVCEVLDVANSRDAVARLDDDEKGVVLIDTPGGTQELQAVNEAGLYSLILGSRKPEAKQFKRWVTHEVLPSIRKTGQYVQQPTSIEDLIIMQAQSVKALREEMESVKQIISTNQETLTVVSHRIDTLDKIDVDGDDQQKLSRMIRKYAMKNGITFAAAWKEFKQAYNTAYHTNLKTLMDNYKAKYRLKTLSAPQYLSLTGKLQDALRVADKMLNMAKAV